MRELGYFEQSLQLHEKPYLLQRQPQEQQTS